MTTSTSKGGSALFMSCLVCRRWVAFTGSDLLSFLSRIEPGTVEWKGGGFKIWLEAFDGVYRRRK